MSIHRLFEAETILANADSTSNSVELYDGRNFHSIQYEITGDGVFDFVIYTSHDGQNWINNGIKADNVDKTSGPDSDGKDIIGLRVKIGNHLKVKAIEVGTTDAGVLTMWFTQK